jgi:hypothetical protein
MPSMALRPFTELGSPHRDGAGLVKTDRSCKMVDDTGEGPARQRAETDSRIGWAEASSAALLRGISI